MEGQTEEAFVRDVLSPHLASLGLYLCGSILATKRSASGAVYRGGVSAFGHVKGDLDRLLGDSNAAFVTTMLDYAGLPGRFPGMDTRPQHDAYARVTHVEQAIARAIDHPRFIPFLMLHEFESLLFCELDETFNTEPTIAKALRSVAEEYPNPELINERPDSAPSKRITRVMPGYQKVLHGSSAAKRLGLLKIREKCRHFDQWLRRLEAHASEANRPVRGFD